MRAALAHHGVDWRDGRTRLDFLVEVVRSIEATLSG